MSAPVAMEYRVPPSHLADRISSLYELRQGSPSYDALERADRPQFRVMISGGGHYVFADGHRTRAHRLCVLGPTSGPVRGVGFGPMHVIGAGLLPAAWKSIADRDADRSMDTALDGAILWEAAADDLVDGIAAAGDLDERLQLVCDFLARWTQPADAECARFVALVDDWLTSSPDPQLSTLACLTGLSMRQIERRIKTCYGLPPKLLARKYRALRAASALARGDDAAEAVIDGFYDQSHMIREVKRFYGLTPQQIRNADAPLIREVALGRKALASRVGLLVSDA